MSDTESSINVLLLVISSFLVIVLMFGTSVYGWTHVPAGSEVPIHWNVRGEVDDYASPGFAFSVIPVVAAFISALIAVIARLDPRRRHMAANSRVLAILTVVILVVLAIIHGGVVWAGLGHPVDMTSAAGVSVGVWFLFLGNFLGKMRSNFIMGIRPPWTLSSDYAWNKTHRLAGRLFAVLGLLIIGSALASGSYLVLVIPIGVVVTGLGLIAYS